VNVKFRKRLILGVWITVFLAGCASPVASTIPPGSEEFADNGNNAQGTLSIPTPFPTRPIYQPGELVDYIAQTGDTLTAVAVHFNTTVAEILEANTFIPPTATTLPPGMPMKIPIYYAPLWGSPYQILPDSLFINGPAQVGFQVADWVESRPGWLKDYREYASGENRTGAEIVNLVALNFSISPRLLLALLEYQADALSLSHPGAGSTDYVLGYIDSQHKGMYLQLVWAANTLNNGYYGWRTGAMIDFERLDGRFTRLDPWQNAATASLQYYFSHVAELDAYDRAVSPEGFAKTYTDLFGDPWLSDQPHIPGSLEQPELRLPFSPGKPWAYTGGPHTGWGEGLPLAAIDFAPSGVSGCAVSQEYVTAVAAGVIARSEPAIMVLDLDGDGDERTGWTVFYFHVGTQDRASAGSQFNAGDKIGYPSCEGGRATGTHIHIARRYNGEWISADGVLAFNLEGWVAQNGTGPYLGALKRYTQLVIACDCADQSSLIWAQDR
jgi:LasA protease